MNKNVLIASATFVAGAALGSIVSWNLLKNKYKQIADEEIESVKEVFKDKTKELNDKLEELNTYNGKVKETLNNTPEPEAPKQGVVKFAESRPYVGYGEAFNKGVNQDLNDINKEISEKAKDIVNDCNNIVHGGSDVIMPITPYVIKPDEFDAGDYDVITLRYYDDDVVTMDNTGRVLTEDEIEECVGLDSLTHFGEYEEDSVFVRNDNLKIDYEILRDEDDYYDE